MPGLRRGNARSHGLCDVVRQVSLEYSAPDHRGPEGTGFVPLEQVDRFQAECCPVRRGLQRKPAGLPADSIPGSFIYAGGFMVCVYSLAGLEGGCRLQQHKDIRRFFCGCGIDYSAAGAGSAGVPPEEGAFAAQ
ncbi:hypothetical protein D3C75_713700 [compost metagenome]